VQTLCYEIWSWLYISWYFFRCCSGLNPTMMFRFFGTAGLSECCEEWVHMHSVGEERNAYTCLFLCLVPYGTRGKFPSFTYKDSSWLFWRCSFMLTSILSKTIESFHVRAITCHRPGNAGAWITISQKLLGLVCAKLGQSAFSSMATMRIIADQDSTVLK
jgi:hypothetical protein